MSQPARELLSDPSTELFLSVASAWEIGIKHAAGKLRLPEPPESYLPSRLTADAIASLAITQAHALRAASLPPVHRDPFDRMLVAQAQLEKLSLMTADSVVSGYEVDLVDI